uniref:Uncharacterized protein n=1 Tax=Tanacetum cinerariifolium TaxID=118510 RepID=A0A6L2N674_TANCI|nr:hypothetical protein [Tanacetum cinerariifolium]
MLATRRYPQWRSRFLRYIDTRPNGEALRKCILSGPYKPTTVLVQAVDATDDSPVIPEHTIVETPMNMSPENKAHFEAEKEAIHLILTRIGYEIYSTVDACQTAQETTDFASWQQRIRLYCQGKENEVAAEDAELQKVLEESMKTAYADAPRGPLPPVIIREPESRKYQSLPEVPGKGKAKVTKEHVAHDLLSLQKPKKKSHSDQYIFQRRVSKPTGSSGHDESPYVMLGQSESEEESEKVVLWATAGGKDKDQAGPDPGAQAEGKSGSDAGAQNEGQDGINPDETSKVQAGPDPGNAGAAVQSIPSPVVHAGSDREHMDLDVADVSPQPSTEQLDEGFTATAYPRDISFGDLFFSDKPSDADKNAETKVKSMVNVLIQQALSSISLMTSPIIDLTSRPKSPKVHQQFKATTTDTTTTKTTTKTKTKTTTTTLPPPQAQQQSTAEAMMIKRIGELEHIMSNLIKVNKDMEERLEKHGARLYTLEQLNIPQQVRKAISEVVTDVVDWAMQAPLRNRFRDLPEADMKEILHQRMWEIESYKTHEDHAQLFEALEKSMNRDHSKELSQDLAKACKKKKKSRESPKTSPGSPPNHPPPPPLPAGPLGASGAPGASGSSQVPPPPPPPSSTNQESPSKGSAAPSSSKIASSTEYQAWTTIDIRLMPSISLTPTDLEIDKDMAPDEQAQSSDDEDIGSAHILTTGDIATFMDWFCKRRGITELKPQDLEGPAFKIVKVFHPDVIHLQYQMEECHKLLTDSVDDPILRHNFSKPLPLGGPPGQVTIQSDFFFNKDLEYLRYGSKGRRPAMSISNMKVAEYPNAGLEQMVPDQFWIEEECKYNIAAMYGIFHWWFQRQRFYIDRHTSEGDRSAVRTHMRILSVVRIKVFSMYRYDYMKKIVLRRADLNEHVIAERDFNDGTLQQIDEALDYRVKEFRINRMNSGLNTRFWTRKDVDWSKAFMFAIQRRLKTKRIFRNLESFVGGCVREGNYRLLKRTE